MKTTRMGLRVLTVLLAAASLVLFFFPFAEIMLTQGALNVSGAELAFGSDVTGRLQQLGAGVTGNLWRSSWFLIAMIWCALTAVIAGLGFKFKKCLTAAPVLAVIGGILMLVLVLGRGAAYVDTRAVSSVATVTGVSMTLFAVLSCVLLFAAALSGFGQILVNDHIAVLESKGQKLSIPKRIARFFRDYKGEIKKIVWPTGKSVLRNTLVVLVMFLLVGAFIWLLDWGLSALLRLILG